MGEVKSVKVDNWGVFFLQKLQNFFNKTDYCDLTLQFNDNSQLKVHRLVLNACTDYFNGLEETCEVIDDALVMPNEFQADVVVPIVNFMYTGTLEFQLSMYDKLLHTAKEMNMTVLLKLLEAHRRTMESAQRSQRPPSPKALRRQNKAVLGRGLHGVTITATNRGTSTSMQPMRSNNGSKVNQARVKQETNTSPFEQLRKGYNNNKRPAVPDITPPAAKKPNLEDVKEFAEQQRMRKMIAAEYIDDQDYEALMDDDVHTDDDDDEPPVQTTRQQPSTSKQSQAGHTTRIQYGDATIIFQYEKEGQPPTIVVKDPPGKTTNHRKIINEVLQKYPNLLKCQKSFKLKVLANPKQASISQTVTKQDKKTDVLPPELSQKKLQHLTIKKVEKPGAQTATLPYKPVANTQKVLPAAVATSTPKVAQQKRRIDSKTMHALLALGAENTTGPWLCLRCGVNGRPISIPSYSSFRRHLVNTHKEIIDPALCEHCGWRSSSDCELHFHIYTDHKVKSEVYTFPSCSECSQSLMNEDQLENHMNEKHPESAKLQKCLYCDEMVAKDWAFYDHLRTYHRREALEDGVIDEAEVEDDEFLHEEELMSEVSNNAPTVKIISNVSLPASNLGGTKYAELTTVESFVPTKESELQFINEQGQDISLTPEERKKLLEQISQEHKIETMGDNKILLVMDDGGNKSTMSDDVDMDARSMTEVYSGEQIYKEFTQEDTSAKTKNSSELDESKESNENLEWAENLLMQHEAGEQKREKEVEIKDKLKQLTSDWTEDENEDDFEYENEVAAKPSGIKTDAKESKQGATDDKNEKITMECNNDQEADDVDLALENLHKETSLDGVTIGSAEEQAAEDSKQKCEVSSDETSKRGQEAEVMETETLRDTLLAELTETESKSQHLDPKSSLKVESEEVELQTVADLAEETIKDDEELQSEGEKSVEKKTAEKQNENIVETGESVEKVEALMSEWIDDEGEDAQIENDNEKSNAEQLEESL